MPKGDKDTATAIPAVRGKFYVASVNEGDEGDEHHGEAYYLADNLEAVLQQLADGLGQQSNNFKDGFHVFLSGSSTNPKRSTGGPI